ncbi:MAG TPA: amidohydrolase family protein [Steroidobacteraceae bacterium]|nr:amidohydrolase family protein [Steroidobacteraceae bacterium]
MGAFMLGLILGPMPVRAEPNWNITRTDQPFTDIELTVTEGTWMSVDVSPDGKSIVFDLLGDIYSIPAAGGDATLIHGGAAMQRAATFSPDGLQLLYLSDESGCDNLWVSKLDGSGARQITHERVDLLMGPAWTPDGQGIAASKIDSTYPRLYSSEIRLFNVSGVPRGGGRVLVPVPQNRRDVQEVNFSRDGLYAYYTQRLTTPNVFVDANHINYGIERRDLQTGQVDELLSGFGGAVAPQISPDGRRLAFVRRVKAKTVLFALNPASHEQRPVYDGLDRDLEADFVPQGNYYPHFAWFPDNRHVAIWSRGKLLNIDMDTGIAVDIPFRVTAHHRITQPVRFKHELAPPMLTVRAIRNIAMSPDGRTLLLTALGHLWRKTLPDGPPASFRKAPQWEFDPAFANDGRKVAFVEWDDEKGSALVLSSADGRRSQTIATSPGVIRQPRFSADGKRVVYRVQRADVSMGGDRAKPGIFWVDARGGISHFVAEGDDAPMFSPDGQRIYYVVQEYSEASVVQHLWSATLEGFDKREHVRTPDADTTDLRLSPDLHWIAFRDRQQYFVAPYHETGTAILLSAATPEPPVRALTSQGGFGLTWSSDSSTVAWSLGPDLFKEIVDQRFWQEAGPARSFASVGLNMPTDVPQGTVAFVNGRIITLRADEVIEKGTVLVVGNRISAVGTSESVEIPEDAKVINVAGKTLMPGLIDAHGHIDCCYETGAMPHKQPLRYAALAYGVTTNFDPYPNELTSYESTEATLAGMMVGPRWIGTGAALYGHAQKADFLYVPIESFTDAQNILARKQALGGWSIKSYKQPARYQRQMLVKAAREDSMNVVVEGESHFYNNITMILDGHTNLEHNLPVSNYYDDVVQLMAKAGAHNTPTLVVAFGELFGENYLYQSTEAWKEPKVRTFVQQTLSGYSPLAVPYGAPPYARGMTSIHAADEIYDIGFRSVARSTRKLDDAGVVINAGSHGQLAGLALHWEMWLLVQGGMSNLHVLRAATLNGANSLGVDAELGSLEPGKLADLIVLDRNPLQDIHNTSSVRYTMVNGRLYDAFTMDEIGNYDRPRTRFYWEVRPGHGIDWNAAWGGQ